MPLPRQKRLKVLAQLLIRLRQRKQFVRQKARGKLNLPSATPVVEQPAEILQQEKPRPQVKSLIP